MMNTATVALACWGMITLAAVGMFELRTAVFLSLAALVVIGGIFAWIEREH